MMKYTTKDLIIYGILVFIAFGFVVSGIAVLIATDDTELSFTLNAISLGVCCVYFIIWVINFKLQKAKGHNKNE